MGAEEELEDGVEWFEEDKCASAECKRPKGKRVAWVRGLVVFDQNREIDNNRRSVPMNNKIQLLL